MRYLPEPRKVKVMHRPPVARKERSVFRESSAHHEPGFRLAASGLRRCVGFSFALLFALMVSAQVPAEAAAPPKEVMVKIRYNWQPIAATIYPEEGNRAKIVFKDPQHSVTPGQAAVCYEGDLVLGGGWIDRAPLTMEIAEAQEPVAV